MAHGSIFNFRSAWSIYKRELMRAMRTAFQSILSPVLTTSLYFVVFGTVIGARMEPVDGVSYGAFIIPGLLMLTLLGETTSNSSFGIYMPRFTGTIYELLSAPVGVGETLVGFVGAAATKALFIGVIILATAGLFVDLEIAHPAAMVAFLLLTCISFSLFGFIIGIWAKSFEQLNLVPLLVVTPLVFLGGSFYSITMLPPIWQTISLFNPVLYLVSGFRWSFFGTADVPVLASLIAITGFTALGLAIVWWIFRTGYRLKT